MLGEWSRAGLLRGRVGLRGGSADRDRDLSVAFPGAGGVATLPRSSRGDARQSPSSVVRELCSPSGTLHVLGHLELCLPPGSGTGIGSPRSRCRNPGAPAASRGAAPRSQDPVFCEGGGLPGQGLSIPVGEQRLWGAPPGRSVRATRCAGKGSPARRRCGPRGPPGLRRRGGTGRGRPRFADS